MKTSKMRTDYEEAACWLRSGIVHDLAERFSDHREAAYVEERDKTVAWLRDGGANNIVETHRAYLWDLANDIEAERHLK